MERKGTMAKSKTTERKSGAAVRVELIVSQQRWGKQTRKTWKALAHKCASETVDDIQKQMDRFKQPRLTTGQKVVVFAMTLGSIIGAMDMVADEAVKGEDVHGALAG